MTGVAAFETRLARWKLEPDGRPIVTPAAHLLPVRRAGEPAMLKIALVPEEAAGAALMAWWDGDGAARVLALDGDALLMERAEGARSLAEMSSRGRDDEATRIVCGVVDRLHSGRASPPPALIPLGRRFDALWPAAAAQGEILARAARAARLLLDAPRDMRVLHGDVHHGNILDFGRRGWLAIDPKGLHGERGYDYANLFCNPDLGVPTCRVARTPERFAARLAIVAGRAGIARGRLLRWILAGSGLSAAWSIAAGDDPQIALDVARLAAAELDR